MREYKTWSSSERCIRNPLHIRRKLLITYEVDYEAARGDDVERGGSDLPCKEGETTVVETRRLFDHLGMAGLPYKGWYPLA
jgi:hypothetical protein